MQKTDAQLQQDVHAEVRRDPRLVPAMVGVSVRDGVVTLTGSVTTWDQKLAAEEAAHRVGGALDVANDVTVELPGPDPSDAALAHAIRHALQWDVFVPDERITSSVSHGFITLGGEVETFAQRDDAARAVRNLPGVVAVANRIAVRPLEVPITESRRGNAIVDFVRVA